MIMPSGFYTINFRQGLGTLFSDVQRSFQWDMTIPIDIINKIKVAVPSRGKNNRPLTNLPGAGAGVPVPTLGGAANYLLIEEDFIIKCRSASIPSKSIDTIETSYMGHKKIFPSKTTFQNQVTITYEENERMTMKRFFDDWQWTIYNSDFKSGGDVRETTKATGNAGNQIYSRMSYLADLQLAFYAYNGLGLEKNIMFYNCWPKEVAEVGVSYEGGGEAIKYAVTFAYDYWEIQPNALIKFPKVV